MFFFKQKTAYEMRISDWSSDLCSSDLCRRDAQLSRPAVGLAQRAAGARAARAQALLALDVHRPFRDQGDVAGDRSEEHTSELQSLMRISYAVFCLKKKNKQYITNP